MLSFKYLDFFVAIQLSLQEAETSKVRHKFELLFYTVIIMKLWKVILIPTISVNLHCTMYFRVSNYLDPCENYSAIKES